MTSLSFFRIKFLKAVMQKPNDNSFKNKTTKVYGKNRKYSLEK